jgi:hypothetical protein
MEQTSEGVAAEVELPQTCLAPVTRQGSCMKQEALSCTACAQAQSLITAGTRHASADSACPALQSSGHSIVEDTDQWLCTHKISCKNCKDCAGHKKVILTV